MDNIASIMSNAPVVVGTFDLATLESISAANREPPSVGGGKKYFDDDNEQTSAVDDLFATFGPEEISMMNNDRIQGNSDGSFGVVHGNDEDILVSSDEAANNSNVGEVINENNKIFEILEDTRGSYSDGYVGENELPAANQPLNEINKTNVGHTNAGPPNHEIDFEETSDGNQEEVAWNYDDQQSHSSYGSDTQSDSDESEIFEAADGVLDQAGTNSMNGRNSLEYAIGNGSGITNVKARAYSDMVLRNNQISPRRRISPSNEVLNLSDIDSDDAITNNINDESLSARLRNASMGSSINITDDQYMAYKRYISSIRGDGDKEKMNNKSLELLLSNELFSENQKKTKDSKTKIQIPELI